MNFIQRLKMPTLFYETKCPGCEEPISFFVSNSISVKCESENNIVDKDMSFLRLWIGCKNPFCKWSNLNKDEKV